jgi:hypothetical protein
LSENPSDEVLAKLRELGAKFDALEVDVRKLRGEVSARIDALSDSAKYLRQGGETRSNVGDRAIRSASDVCRSWNDQLASTVLQIRNLDSRVRAIEDNMRRGETFPTSGVFRDGPW